MKMYSLVRCGKPPASVSQFNEPLKVEVITFSSRFALITIFFTRFVLYVKSYFELGNAATVNFH
jgi:hypothetical protein